MSEVTVATNRINTMSDVAIEKVYKLDEEVKKLPPVEIKTHHTLHGGMYARTITIPAGTVLTGALIKIPTLLIIDGDVVVYVDGEPKELHGYNVFAASGHRKQAFFAGTDTFMTMVFPTSAKTVEDAEKEFTDEWELLLSNKNADTNIYTITGE